MKFVAIATAVGVAGTLLASNLQGAVSVPGEGLPAAALTESEAAEGLEGTKASGAVRLIDLKAGTTCKVARPSPETETFSAVRFAPDCTKSPGLARIAYWRSTADGSLILADNGGGTVLRFAPGDGVLYESVYPRNALITIVPARG